MEIIMNYQQFQFLLILWKMGVVDTFGVMKICANCGAQYMGVVLSSAAGNFSSHLEYFFFIENQYTQSNCHI